MAEKLIRYEGGGVRASDIKGIHRPFGDVIAIVTRDGLHYLTQYATHHQAEADLVRMMDEWDEWGAKQ